MAPISSEKAFRDGDGVARKYLEVFAAALGEAFCVHAQNLVLTGCGATPHAHTFGRGYSRGAARHSDRLQKINTVRASLGHFITPRTVDLAENRKAPFRITDEAHSHPWIYEIIATIELGDLTRGLRQAESGEVNGTDQGQTQISFAVQSSVSAQVIFAENFDRYLIVRSQNVTRRSSQSCRSRSRRRTGVGRRGHRANDVAGRGVLRERSC